MTQIDAIFVTLSMMDNNNNNEVIPKTSLTPYSRSKIHDIIWLISIKFFGRLIKIMVQIFPGIPDNESNSTGLIQGSVRFGRVIAS